MHYLHYDTIQASEMKVSFFKELNAINDIFNTRSMRGFLRICDVSISFEIPIISIP